MKESYTGWQLAGASGVTLLQKVHQRFFFHWLSVKTMTSYAARFQFARVTTAMRDLAEGMFGHGIAFPQAGHFMGGPRL